MPLLELDASSDVNLAWRVDAPPSRVWECLTDSTLLSQWLGEVIEGAVDADRDVVVDHGEGYCCRSTVTTCVEQSRLVLTWLFPDEHESEVTFELAGSVDATELRLTHRGLAGLAASYRNGWCVHLTYLEAAALAAPLPRSMFWPLHGTIAQLNTR